MVEDAEKKGKLKPGSVIIEATSGNTGIALSLVAAVKGYRCIIIMPEHCSGEKLSVLQALGAEIIRTPKFVLPDHPASPHRLAQKLCKEIPNSIILNQFRNPGNPLSHYDTTAEEILDQLGGNIDVVVAGTGTGATITGIGRKVKERCLNCKIVGCDPFGYYEEKTNLETADSPAHEIEGIGLLFQSTVLDPSIVDEWIKVDDKDAFQMARLLMRKEGILCGESSGSVLCAGIKAAKDLKENQKCVLIFGDGVRNYMMKLINDDWLASRGFIDISPKISEKHWWWNFEVSSLELPTALTVLPSMYCHDIINIMKTKSLNIIPVVGETGNIKGVITLEKIMSGIITGKITKTTNVNEVLYNEYPEITTNTTLGHLSTILNQEHFALVVHKEMQPISIEKGKRTIINIVTKLNFIHFIFSQGKENGNHC